MIEIESDFESKNMTELIEDKVRNKNICLSLSSDNVI
jgi:hypothetical protein